MGVAKLLRHPSSMLDIRGDQLHCPSGTRRFHGVRSGVMLASPALEANIDQCQIDGEAPHKTTKIKYL